MDAAKLAALRQQEAVAAAEAAAAAAQQQLEAQREGEGVLQVGMQRCSCVLINWGASASPAGLLVMMHGNHCSLPALFSHHPSSVPTHPDAHPRRLRRCLCVAHWRMRSASCMRCPPTAAP